MLVLEVTSVPQETSLGARGTSFMMTSINIESEEIEKIQKRFNLTINEELFIIVTDNSKERTILILNDTIIVPRKTDEKKGPKLMGPPEIMCESRNSRGGRN